MNKRPAFRLLLVSAAIVLLAGCPVPYSVVLSRFQTAPVSIESFSEFPFDDFKYDDFKDVLLDEKSPVFVFETGKSYFAAYRLPPFETPYRIVVQSFLLGDNMKRAFIFYPRMIFLDGAFKTTRETDDRFVTGSAIEMFGRLKLRGTMGTFPGLLQGEIMVDETNRDDRYMIVLTTDKLTAVSTMVPMRTSIPIFLPGVGVGAIPGGVREIQAQNSPGGRVHLFIEKQPD